MFDRRVEKSVRKFTASGPVFSVAANSEYLACGTHEDILLWDMKKADSFAPTVRFEESHNADVTGLQFRGKDLISCSIDNVLNMFKIENGNTEEDMIDGAYSSI
jgi:WD40 repeat protein